MKLLFHCGVCKKDKELVLADKSHIYLVGNKRGEMIHVDADLCAEDTTNLKKYIIISRVNCNIRWKDNAWQIFDGWPEGAKTPNDKKSNTSALGTFIEKKGKLQMVSHTEGCVIEKGDRIFFVPSSKLETAIKDAGLLSRYQKELGSKIDALKNMNDGLAVYSGFKYMGEVLDAQEKKDDFESPEFTAPNLFVKTVETSEIKVNSTNMSYYVALDIRKFTKQSEDTQIEWARQFNGHLSATLEKYNNYMLILVGDGAYISFLGDRHQKDIHYEFVNRFFDLMKEKKTEWVVKTAIHFGHDYLLRVEICGRLSNNMYGTGINTIARLMEAHSEPFETIVSNSVHSDIYNIEPYRSKYNITKMEPVIVKDRPYDYYLYSKKERA